MFTLSSAFPLPTLRVQEWRLQRGHEFLLQARARVEGVRRVEYLDQVVEYRAEILRGNVREGRVRYLHTATSKVFDDVAAHQSLV